jgi:hypothetical protein
MDWVDPNQWKPLAALADYWKAVAVAVVAIGGAIGTVARWGFAPVRSVWTWLRRVALRARTVEHHGYRYRKGPDGTPKGKPYCPLCESNALLIRMTKIWEMGRPWQCPKCQAKFNNVTSFFD